MIEFPNAWHDDAPAEAVIKKGGKGEVVGKLDSINDAEMWAWTGAFCGTSRKIHRRNRR